ncbi:MAG: beta-glucosidase, partial [Actinomycetota bacterium]|nr:beta-glucosidase [Actinomycetota bacterium]
MTRHVPRRRVLLALVAVGATVSGLVAPAAVSALSAAPAAAADHVLPYQDPRQPIATRVSDLLSRMSTAEKIGQMTQTERYQVFDDPSPITTYGLGSILSGGGSTPATNAPAAWADMIDRFQAAALKTRLGIPLLYGIDSVHGDGNLYGAT